MLDKIIVKGACEHNLKNVNLEIPKNKFVVFTGVSGSGKSSMAFDTIYAEGQRRYVESLSSYARQFLGVMGKPDVDTIEGLSPSISIDQKSVSQNPRSTVGTITEIYDYLRLLFARIGHPYCPNCGIEIKRLTPDEIAEKIIQFVEKKLNQDKLAPIKFNITSPIVRERKGSFEDLFDNLRAKGFSEMVIDNQNTDLSEDISLIKTNKHSIEVTIEKFSLNYSNFKDKVFSANLRSRIFASVEQSLSLSAGLVNIKNEKNSESLTFSEKFSCPNCNMSLSELEPRMFSFNSPSGACTKCKGLGFISTVDRDLIFNKKLSINEGGIIPYSKVFFQETWFSRLFKTFLDDSNIDSSIPIGQLPAGKLKLLCFGGSKIYKVQGLNRFGKETSIWEKFIGIIPGLEKKYFESDSDFTRWEIERYMTETTCDSCQGKRLKSEVLSVMIEKKSIYDLGEFDIQSSIDFFENLSGKLNPFEKNIATGLFKEIENRLLFLRNVGLSYLTLNRSSRSLSGGEAQRIRLASQIGSGLTGVTYVLDEPSIGLHPSDVAALIKSLKNLKDLGNTIIVVEHDTETVKAADYVVDFGPLAGKNGGKIVFSGSVAELVNSKQSLTGQYISGRKKIESKKHEIQSSDVFLKISGCRQFNLKNITAKFPLGKLVCVTGVSGSGKSTLVVETLYKALRKMVDNAHLSQIGTFDHLDGFQYIDNVYLVDQSPIGRTPRSNPATYVGVFNHIRDLFAATVDARAAGYKKGRFSFNVRGGRCEKCGGAGTIKIEMQFLPDVYIKCDVCDGRRYNFETLQIKYKDKNIYDILNMTVNEAADFFGSIPQVRARLKTLEEVGLGYIELGQPAPTLSGGEAQRVKLANELSKRETGRTVYILDEPTVGLHLYDVEKLLNALYQLVGKGNTVIIIEHNLDVIKNCQYAIDLGPGGGDEGGKIIYQGKVEGLQEAKDSLTGKYLKKGD